MKCINCGVKTDKLIENICYNCYSNKSLVKEIKKIKLRYCYSCFQLYYRNRRIEDLTPILKKYIIPNEHMIIDDVTYELDIKFKEIKLGVIGHFEFDKKKHIEEKYEIHIELNEFYCDHCRAKSSQGYAAIVQLRNKVNANYDKVKDEIRPLLDKEANLVKYTKLNEGDDFYVAKIDKAYQIAKKMIQKYGGQINITKKLFTQDKETSKQVFRVTMHLKLYDFSLKDLVFVNNSVYSINKITKQKILLKNLYENHSIIKPFYEIKETIKPDEIIKTQVISVKPQIEVLNASYENVILITNKKHEIDDKLKVYINKNVAFEIF